jgi:hypothetical protein
MGKNNSPSKMKKYLTNQKIYAIIMPRGEINGN